MSTIYLESSAALAWLFGQRDAGAARKAVDAAEVVVTSALTFTEIERVLVRAEIAGSIKAGDAQRARGVLQRARSGWVTMAISGEVLERAGRPFPVEPLRALDAIHLATALAFTRAYGDLKVVTFDRRMQENAAALGID